MHIPDGFLSPATAVAMYGAAAPFWWVASQRVRRVLSGQTVPLIAIFAALSFVIMMFDIPIPGGTSAHAVGAVLAAIVAGPWAAIIALTVALVIQAFFFGDGGITAIGANAFNLAIAMPLVGYAVYRVISRGAELDSRRQLIAAAVAGYVGINVAGLLVALQLGIQPIFWTEDGRALYAPYELGVTVPALMLPHLTIAGLAEVVVTVFGLAYVRRAHPHLLVGAPASPAPDVEVESRPSSSRWRVPAAAAILIALMLLVPLGLLAGTPDWLGLSEEEIQERAGYVPTGFDRLSGIWDSPFPDYTLPWIPEEASFAEEALAYVTSAVIGVGLIFMIFFAVRILVRRRAGPAPVAGT
jgi:cobalt/nickel transport system permease protein